MKIVHKIMLCVDVILCVCFAVLFVPLLFGRHCLEAFFAASFAVVLLRFVSVFYEHSRGRGPIYELHKFEREVDECNALPAETIGIDEFTAEEQKLKERIEVHGKKMRFFYYAWLVVIVIFFINLIQIIYEYFNMLF